MSANSPRSGHSDAGTGLPAILLAGGRSSRMGMPKALAELGGQRLIDRVTALLAAQAGPLVLSANDETITLPGVPRVADEVSGWRGPLAGLAAALGWHRDHSPLAHHALVVPVDCPFLPDDLAARLLKAGPGPSDIVLAASRGRRQPLVGLWPMSLAEPLAEWLSGGGPEKVGLFLEGRPVTIVAFDDRPGPRGPIDPFFNVNTPEDLAEARAILGDLAP